MRVEYNYKIGDDAHSNDLTNRRVRYSSGHDRVGHSDGCLEVGDGAFICDQPTDIGPTSWTYAIVVEVAPDYIVFQVDADGRTRKLNIIDWRQCVQLLPKGHSSGRRPGTMKIPAYAYHPTTIQDDENEQVTLRAITAHPVYANKSFEELRLEDYTAGNKGTKVLTAGEKRLYNHHRATHLSQSKMWGGSDLNNFLEVDLGSKHLILRRPLPGDDGTKMYSKKQLLHIIKSTTVRSSRERGILIKFLNSNKLVPNQRALYKILERDQKGLSITDNYWGEKANLQQMMQPVDMIYWDSTTTSLQFESPARVPTKRVDIGDAAMAKKEFFHWNLRDEKGWKGSIQLHVKPIQFSDLGTNYLRQGLQCNFPYKPIDICKFMREWGKCHPERVCRLYFNPKKYPCYSDTTFTELKDYIRNAAARDGSTVICNGGKKGVYKIFRCNKMYRSSSGKQKKCPFRFQVRWDCFGYYIYLAKVMSLHNCGAAWHCCKPAT